MRTIVTRIEHAAKGDGTVTFMTGNEPVTKTWAEVHHGAKAMAFRLQEQGIGHGDHVAVLGPTTADLVTAFQAIWLCGATLVVLPLPMRLASLDEFTKATKARITNADCVAVIIDPDLAPFVEPTPGDPPLLPLPELAGTDADADRFSAPDYSEDDIFVLQFTSGSTSEPKGVVLPNHVVAANLDAILEAASVTTSSDVMVSWLPLYHDMGLVGFCILPMAAGLNLVLGAPQDFLARPGRWMEWISSYGGTATAGPNFSWVLATRALKNMKEPLDLSSLRIALNGAEPVDPDSVRAFVAEGERHGLRPGAIFPAFGMAEIAIAGCFPKPMVGLTTDVVDANVLEQDHLAVPIPAEEREGNSNAREIVLLGWPVPGLEFRVVDPASNEVLSDRKVGELQIRGTSVTPGYYQRPEANDELFDGDWLKTGDLAYMLDGQMAMCGRIKDLIIVGGRNVYPQDIERAVGELNSVRTGNVIAFSATGRNGKEHVVVVAETRMMENLDEVRSQVSDATLQTVGVPCREVVLVSPSSLPKTSSGKLQRALCRKQYLDEELTLV